MGIVILAHSRLPVRCTAPPVLWVGRHSSAAGAAPVGVPAVSAPAAPPPVSEHAQCAPPPARSAAPAAPQTTPSAWPPRPHELPPAPTHTCTSRHASNNVWQRSGFVVDESRVIKLNGNILHSALAFTFTLYNKVPLFSQDPQKSFSDAQLVHLPGSDQTSSELSI